MMAGYDLLIGARRKRTGPWLWCAWFGHRWDSDVDPVCERPRCRWRLADYEPDRIAGGVYMGWGRYGTITPAEAEAAYLRRRPA